MVQEIVQLDQIPQPSHGGCGSCGSGSAAKGLARCGNGLEKIYPTTAVRFGYMRFIGEFTHSPDMKFSCGAKVVIQSRRGIEIGEQVSLTCTGCDKSVSRDQMKEWVKQCGEDSFMFGAGRILREATSADLAESAHIKADCVKKMAFCQTVAKRYKLPLKVIECECPLGGERIIFFFTSAERVDFRAMVKDLAKEYRTRIEMRQVGARDEARLLADYETCGREICCKTFLKTLRPVSMRMAKVQKATLDPSQVSGRCGRLKCCLRYEHVAYEELDKKLPRVGVRIRTNHGEGVVVNRQILTQLVQIRDDANTLVTVVAEDITEVGIKPSPPRPEQPQGRDKRPDPSARRERRGRPSRGRGGETQTPRPNERSEPPKQDAGTPGADQTTRTGDRTEADKTPGDSTSRKKPRRRRRNRRGKKPNGPETQGGSAPGES